jgi:hypothetical protein
MKRIPFLPAAALVLSFLSWPCISAAAADPTTIDFNGDWGFTYTTSHAETPPPASAFTALMPVPGCWDDTFDRGTAAVLWPTARVNPRYQPIRYPMSGKPPDASLPFLFGTGWYRRTLQVPADWQGRQIFLNVGRVVMEAWVHINGRLVHHHAGYSTTWTADLGPHLRPGALNDIVIAVDNTRTDRIGTIIRGWAGRSAGIFGPVSLRVAGEAGIAELYVHPRGDKLTWRVELRGETPERAEVRWKISEREGGAPIASGIQPASGSALEWSTGSTGLKPWSDTAPNLYQIEAALYSGERRLDQRVQPFGLRQLTAQGTGLRLNGRPIFLRGNCEHAYYPETTTPPVGVDWYRRHIRRLKDVGFNWIRFHTSVPLEPYLQAADELGMLVQVEAPAGFTLPEWRDILRFSRTHPSVVLYCGGNEEVLDEKRIEFLARCAAELRVAVPDGLFNPQSAMRGVEYGFTAEEIKSLPPKPFPHHPARLARIREFSDVFGAYALGRLSYSSLLGVPVKLDENLSIYERPSLSHELSICGSYLNLELEERYRDSRIGRGLFAGAREQLAQAGLLDRAPLYYRNSAAWQRLMVKDTLETARHTRLLSGYDLLGANDTHWHRTGYGCGLLNEFDEMKPGRTAADILSYNGESVLLISDQRERNLNAGDDLRRTVSLSWFGHDALQNATLQAALVAADGTTLARATQRVATVQAGTVAEIAVLNLPTRALDRPTKATLRVEIDTPSGTIGNEWDYWLFPAPIAAPPRDVQVITTLNRATLTAMTEGGRFVLLGSKPLPAQAMTFQMGLAGRPEGNYATVIARHPLADRFPHDGFCDWQFAKMLTNAGAIQFNDMPGAFDPIIEVVSSYKNVRKQAALFEWRVGKGRLLVCSLALPANDPAAVYLRDELLAYAASDAFEPRTVVAMERLAEMLGQGDYGIRAPAKTDQGFDERAQLPKAR